MDADVRELFARSIGDATARLRGATLDDALVDLGWRDALSDDPHEAVAILFERQGADNAASAALSEVVLDALGVDAGAVVLPPIGRWRAPATVDRDHIRVDGVALSAPDRLLVVAQADDKETSVVVPGKSLDVEPVGGVDKALGLLRVSGEVEATNAVPVDWSAGASAGQRALAHELVGASRTMLRLACDHALERVQFDRPIAMFQAVRHRLAETLVAIETAEAAIDAAWLDGSPAAASMAKALAGRGARTAARHCQQVLAGIGFTTEHPLHLYIRRVLVLDQLLGSSKLLTKELGEHVITAGALPAQLPL